MTVLAMLATRTWLGVNELQRAAGRNRASGAALFNLENTGPEMLAKNAFRISGTIANSRQAARVGDLREIKRNLVFATAAFNRDRAFFIVPDRLRNSARIKISATTSQGRSWKLPDAAIF
jgi:hypothetical protein